MFGILCDFLKPTLLVLVSMQLILSGYAQGPPKKYATDRRVKPGSYSPDLYGDYLGRYRHDDSGKYRHVDVPYTGGYGDRGAQYKSTKDKLGPVGPSGSTGPNGSTGPSGTTGPPGPAFKLGQKDHLRFMLDFNYNSNGWQIIQFDWTRDDEGGQLNPKYNYVSESKLWESNDPDYSKKIGSGYFYGIENETTTTNDGLIVNTTTDTVHLDADYESNTFKYNYADKQKIAGSQETRAAINEVLEYIKTNVIPNLP